MDLLTATQLAEKLNIRPATIRFWTRAGHIPSLRLSRRVVRYAWTDVEAALRAAGAVKGAAVKAEPEIEGAAE